MFDGSIDPYDHLLHYNQVMTLNASNDLLLCRVFSASLHVRTPFRSEPIGASEQDSEVLAEFIYQTYFI